MFRAMIYFAGFATLSASAAYALVLAHDTLGPAHQAESPAVVARSVALTPVVPARVQPVVAHVAPVHAPLPAVIKNHMTATAFSLRPRGRTDIGSVAAVSAEVPADVVRTASVDPFQGVERLNPADLRADMPVLAFQGEAASQSGASSDASGDRSAPVTTYQRISAPNPYVSRSAPLSTGERLANNWNVGVYR